MKRLKVKVGNLFVTNGNYFLPDDMIYITERSGDNVSYYYLKDKWTSNSHINSFTDDRLTVATKLHKLLLGIEL